MTEQTEPTQVTDATVEDHGSIVLVRPLTSEAVVWLAEYTDPNLIWFGGAVPVEPRYLDDLVAGMQDGGLVVS